MAACLEHASRDTARATDEATLLAEDAALEGHCPNLCVGTLPYCNGGNGCFGSHLGSGV